MSDSLQPHGLYRPWNSPGQNTGVGNCSLPQGIFPTRGSNPGLLHRAQILYQLSHKGSPRILEWVAYLSPAYIPDPVIELGSPALQVDSLPTELWGKPFRYNIASERDSVVSDSLWPHELYSLWNSPGQNTGVGSSSLLQGIFPTQGSNPGLPHCRWILYQLSHKGSPRILEWGAYRFSRGSSWPWNWTRVSCIVGRFFSNWAIREAQSKAQNSPR